MFVAFIIVFPKGKNNPSFFTKEGLLPLFYFLPEAERRVTS